MRQTTMANAATIERKWYVVDAAGQTLGLSLIHIYPTVPSPITPIFMIVPLIIKIDQMVY